MLKRTIGLLCSAVMAVCFLSGCYPSELFSRENEEVNTLKIGISVYDQYDTFISSMIDYFNELVDQKEQETGMNIIVDYQNAGGKQSIQNDQMETFVNEECDVVFINLVDRTDATTVIDKAKNADIPVIFFNRELVEEDLERWNDLYYVGAVALESGKMQGQILLDACADRFEEFDRNQDGKLQYVILEGEAGHQDALVRTEYVVNTVTEGGVVLEKLANEIANWNRTQAATKMSGWLSRFGDDIEVVFCNNDDMALGVIDALKSEDIEKWPVVLGIDGTDETLIAVRNQEMLGTVLNDAKGQARGCLELAWSLKFKTKLPEDIELLDNTYIRLPYQIITFDNVEKIILEK